MKKILLDENIAVSVGEYLKGFKLDIVHVNDILKGIKDPELFQYVLENQMILITHDKGLMKRFEHVRTHSGVIFITKPGIKETREVLSKISNELFVNKKDLDNTIVKLSPQEYEIKRCRKSWVGYESKVHAYKKIKK